MKRIQNEDLKYEPTSGQNIILGCKSHMGAILTYMATVRLFKTEKQVKMAKISTFCLLLSHSDYHIHLSLICRFNESIWVIYSPQKCPKNTQI